MLQKLLIMLNNDETCNKEFPLSVVWKRSSPRSNFVFPSLTQWLTQSVTHSKRDFVRSLTHCRRKKLTSSFIKSKYVNIFYYYIIIVE